MAGEVEYQRQEVEVEELDARGEVEAGGSGRSRELSRDRARELSRWSERSRGAGQRRLVQVFVKHTATELAGGGVEARQEASVEAKQQLSVGTTMYLDDVATAQVMRGWWFCARQKLARSRDSSWARSDGAAMCAMCAALDMDACSS